MTNSLLKIILLTVALSATVSNGFAQKIIKSEKFKPSWIKNKPKSLNQTYHFEDIITDNGNDLASARNHALNDLARRYGATSTVSSTEILKDSSITAFNGKNSSFQDIETYSMNLNINNADITLQYQVIDEYYERSRTKHGEVFRLYTLYAVSDSPNPTFDQFKLTNKYGANGLWRSMLVPGWGQMYKGSTGKGIAMLTSFLATGGGAFACDYLGKYYGIMADNTNHADTRATYSNWSNACFLGRNVFIGLCAAFYVYNLVDAVVAPGATRVIPVVSPNGAAGVGVVKTF